jgi:hypothetical protein
VAWVVVGLVSAPSPAADAASAMTREAMGEAGA